MARRCFMAIMTLTIALQSVAFSADMDLQHHSVMPHAAHAHVSEALPNEDPTAKRTPADHSHSAGHCHHSHICFHMALMGSVADISCSTGGSAIFAYQAKFPAGIQSSPFRPPIA